jgi:hypothetical protein
VFCPRFEQDKFRSVASCGNFLSEIDTNIKLSESVSNVISGVNAASLCRTAQNLFFMGEKRNNKEASLEGWDQSCRDARSKVSFFYVFIFRNLIAIRYWDASRILAIRERK